MMDPAVRITPMTIADYTAVYALWSATPGLGLTAADSREAIGRYLDRNPGLSFVARFGNRPARQVMRP